MPILSPVITRRTAGTDVLRLVLCAILFTHGAYRFYEGSSPVMGRILASFGIPCGLALTYAVNLTETVGSLLLALRIQVLPACAALATIYATGIFLFHRHAGFFVVGPGSDGWEYSALILTCLFTTAWQHRQKEPAC